MRKRYVRRHINFALARLVIIVIPSTDMFEHMHTLGDEKYL